MNNKVTLLISTVLLVIIVNSSLFTLDESKRGLISRFGQLRPEILQPGVNVKIPFIDEVVYFDNRLILSVYPEARITTREKKDLLVSLFVTWKINDFPRFYNKTRSSMRDVKRAEMLIGQRVNNNLTEQFALSTINEVVSGKRRELMTTLKDTTKAAVEDFGIELVDVRIKRIDLPDDVRDSVYARMRSERKMVAAELRAEGEAKAEEIRAEADKQSVIILASAGRDAEKLKGEGDAFAAHIYAEAFAKAPDFYEFYKTLESYRIVFNKDKQSAFILKPDSEFFKYFSKQGKH